MAETGAGTTSFAANTVAVELDAAGFNRQHVIADGYSTTATLTSVTASTTDATLLASNTNRMGATFFNECSTPVYIAFGAAATTSAYTVQVATNQYYELPFGYKGVIHGILGAGAASGSVRVTEMTV